jgi:hypothetical protein
MPSSNVLDVVDHDLISSCMDCIGHVLPHLDFRTGELSNRPAWHRRDLRLWCRGRSELAVKERKGNFGALRERGGFRDVRLC